MKLRVRPFQSKETLKIEVPNSYTLPQLRQILSETLPDSPSPASIRLSLNRKDDLQSDGAESLQSLGITAGDLIYFSVEEPAAAIGSNSQITLPQVTDSTPTTRSTDSECSTSWRIPQNTLAEVENSDSVMSDSRRRKIPQNTLAEVENSDSVMSDSQRRETLGSGSQVEAETVSNMEVDDDEDNGNNLIADENFEVVDNSFSVPGFMRKVLAAELGGDAGRDHKLIVIAVHAVMLESGFVGVDEKANVVIDGFQLRNEWPSGLFSMSLFYTLPESVRGSGGEALKTVLLKFQNVGNYLNVYGILGKRGMHCVRLKEDELVPFLNVVWANCGVMENVTGRDGETSPEKEVFKFWRSVKDNLALPLLIDFCEEVGFVLPPCFMRLPTELKLKILESLPGVDVAKASCVSSEMRYLGSSDDLWKMKFGEEFRHEMKEGEVSWKKAFSMAWSRRNGRRLASRVRASPFRPMPRPMPMPMPMPMPYWHQPRRRYPNTPVIFERVPPFVGDEAPRVDDDSQTMMVGDPMRLPHEDVVDDLQTMLRGPMNRPMRSFSPRCNLGIRDGRFL